MIHKEVRLFFLLLIYTKQETPSRLGRRFLFRLPLIKGRIESVEILGVQPVGEDAQALAEALEMDDLPFTQKTDGRDHVRVVHQTQNIVIGGAGFLLCCDAVRTALRLLPRLGSVSLDGG